MPIWPIIPIVVFLTSMLSGCTNRSKGKKEDTGKFRNGVAECEKDGEQPCTCKALVCCTSSINAAETVHIKKEVDGKTVLMADIAQLNKTDIDRERPFTGCKIPQDKKCMAQKEYIEKMEWQGCEETNSQGEGKELLNEDKSYMICTYGMGYLYFKDAGQELRSRLEWWSDENRIPEAWKKYYTNNKNLISGIQAVNADGNFDYDIWNFRKIFNNNKSIYETIAGRTGVPAKLVAALHYRESGCNFNTYLHNGQPLGQPTTIVPKGRIFNDFTEAAVDALNSKQKSIGVNLMEDDSIEMMATFAELYNGVGYTKYRNTATPYVYSGTDAYSSGKYTSDGKYDPNKVDKQPGVYLLITSLQEEPEEQGK